VVWLVQELGAELSEDQAMKSYLRNTRFLPPQVLDDYQGMVLLEASEIPKGRLSANEFEAICNRVSKRLLYAIKTEGQRFAELSDVPAEPSAAETQMRINEILDLLSLEEQAYLAMKMEGFSVREIAAKLGIPVSTAQHNWKNITSKIKAFND
jgi:DNA-binding NarL/FixJ family response regulator